MSSTFSPFQSSTLFFSFFQQPKFYKSVIDDVVNNVRELFLDDGVDEQVIQELKKLWEEKIGETKATDHPTVALPTTTMTNSKSNSKKSAAAAAAAATAVAAAASNSLSLFSSNSSSAASASASGATSSLSSAAGRQTSVIQFNPNHLKNGPSNNSPVGQPTGQAPNAVNARIVQLDGVDDSSSDEDDEDEYRDNDDDDNDDEMNDEENDGGIEDEVHIVYWLFGVKLLGPLLDRNRSTLVMMSVTKIPMSCLTLIMWLFVSTTR